MADSEARVYPEGTLLRRQCAACEEAGEKEKILQAKAESPSSSAATDGSLPAAPPIVREVLQAPGQPLDSATRAFFEPRFGRDFSRVEVHFGTEAERSARAVNARAYAAGRHLVFGPGHFAPGTEPGRRLLAHELAHVVQQQGAASGPARLRRAPEEEGGGGASDPVYLCSKSLDRSPVGSHAFFRIGGSGAGNPSLSLQPSDSSLGADCWQGIPGRDYPSDRDAAGRCELTSLSRSCLERQFSAYPIGHYCTLGPNSNTFVGVLARACGLADPDPPGWTPGIDDSAPPSGTFAPSPESTLFGCETKQCIIGPEEPGPPIG